VIVGSMLRIQLLRIADDVVQVQFCVSGFRWTIASCASQLRFVVDFRIRTIGYADRSGGGSFRDTGTAIPFCMLEYLYHRVFVRHNPRVCRGGEEEHSRTVEHIGGLLRCRLALSS
jgi:hypothetical protein